MKVPDQLRRVTERVEQLSLRERVMVTAALLLVVLLPGYSLWLEPLQVRQKQLQTRTQESAQQTRELQAQIEVLQTMLRVDPDLENRRRVGELQMEIAELDIRLQAMAEGLLPPREIPRVLEELLTRQGGLRLVRLENQPPVALLDLSGAPVKESGMNVFRHALQLEFEGSYLEALRYLRELEALPRRLLWEELEIEVQRHPRARVRLGLQTISLKEGWIGI